MNKKIRVGIAGAGFIAPFHVRALRELPFVEVCGVCDVAPARAERLASSSGIAFSCGSLEELAEQSRPDIVHVLTPPTSHESTIRRCLEMGVAVFAEKPVVTNTGECSSILRAHADSGAFAGVNHNAIFHPAFRRMVNLIRQRELGAIEHVIVCVNAPLRQLAAGQHDKWMFALPGNILLEQAPHPLSQVNYLIGKVKQVAALRTGERLLNTGRPFYDTWQVALECERATAQCYFSFGKSFPDSWIYVVGQDGTIFADLGRNTVQICQKGRFVDPADHMRGALATARSGARQGIGNFINYGLGFLKVGPNTDPFYCGLRDSIRAFHEAYRDRKPPPVSLDQACAVVEVCESISVTAAESVTAHASN